MPRQFIIKSRSRRSIPIGKRDIYALNALERLKIKIISKNITELCKIIATVPGNLHHIRVPLINSVVSEYKELLKIIIVEVPPRPVRVRHDPMNFVLMEQKLNSLGITCSERFRFQNFNQLRNLIACFRIPPIIKLKNNYKIEAEECILIVLTRLHFPCRWSDMYPWFPGRKRWFMQAAFYWALDFFIYNWGYLLLNNMPYWKESLALSCEAIRLKLQNLNFETWRQFHPPADQPNGFRYAAFIDNTICAFSRPGGNTEEGAAAQRVPLEVQQAWWTGWKKLHGMKFQTVTLANGMDLHVYGPLSCRNNDLTSLENSDIENLFRDLQQDDAILYKLFGDSAYVETDVLGTGGGRGMASVRESIEHTYKDLKCQWKYCDYKHVLQLRKQPVGKIIFLCMLLRNAYCTLLGSQVALFFGLVPPTLEEWTSQGPNARPLPITNIWSPDYQPDNDYFSDGEDEDDYEDDADDDN